MKLVLSLVFAGVSLLAQTTSPVICGPASAPQLAGCVPQDPALDQGVLSSAQVLSSPNYGTAFQNVIPSTVQLTDAIYNASKPAAVQALLSMPPGDARYTQALALAQQGYTIDPYSDAQGNDPVVTMILRTNYGITWTAPLLTASPLPTPTNPSSNPAPGANLAGWIKTSLSPADYPPFYAPAPVTAAAILGNFQGDVGTCALYGGGPGAPAAVASGTIRNGGTYSAGGATYSVKISAGLFGETISFCGPVQ